MEPAAHKPAERIRRRRLRSGDQPAHRCGPSGRPWAPPPTWKARAGAGALTGENKRYPGVLGTGVVKLPGLELRSHRPDRGCRPSGSGLRRGHRPGHQRPDKAHYYPDDPPPPPSPSPDPPTSCWDSRCLAPARWTRWWISPSPPSLWCLSGGFYNLDYAYAPPFSTAIHPFVQAVYILLNKLSGEFTSLHPRPVRRRRGRGLPGPGCGLQPSVPGALRTTCAAVNGPLDGFEKDAKLLLVCAKGKRGYFLQNQLKRLRLYRYPGAGGRRTFFNHVRVETGVTASVIAGADHRRKGPGLLLG